MDVRQLRYFVGIAESRSLTEAARRVHIVQPALSQRLSDLEKELEVQLVVRGRVGTALTPAGAELYENAKRILKQIDYATAAVREKAGVVEGVLTIGLLRSISPVLSVRLFNELRREMPGVRPQLRVGYSAELEAMLRQGALDMATLVASPGGTGGRTMVFSERLCLVGSSSMLARVPRRPRLKDVAALPLLLSPMQPAHRLVMDAAERAGLALDVVGGIEDAASILELCEEDVGVTILSAFAARRIAQRRGLASLPIAERGMQRHVRIAVQQDANWSAAVLMAESVLDRLLSEVLRHG